MIAVVGRWPAVALADPEAIVQRHNPRPESHHLPWQATLIWLPLLAGGCDPGTGIEVTEPDAGASHADAASVDHTGNSDGGARDNGARDSATDRDSATPLDHVVAPDSAGNDTSATDHSANDQGGGRDQAIGIDTPDFGAQFFVATDGLDSNDGSELAPFATLERGRDAIRALKSGSGLPAGGAVIWLRDGLYPRSATFELTDQDSGDDVHPIWYASYPGETARLVGGVRLPASAFAAVTSSDPAWSRFDAAARASIVVASLPANGVTDYGTLKPRGFSPPLNAALELMIDGEPMPLARWPDADASDPAFDPLAETITLYGAPTPDVTGDYQHAGESDGVNRFARSALVNGKQYYFYRHHWQYQGSWYTAWFLTTSAAGYPSDTDPWWYEYAAHPTYLAPQPASSAAGTPTVINPLAITHGFVRIDQAVSDTVFTYFGTRPERWSAAEEPWFHGYWMFMWADRHARAASIDTGTKSITLDQVPGYGITANQPYYAENLLEEITEPGEWYLNRTNGRLYLWPPQALANAEILVSTLESPLVRVTGASHLTWVGVDFELGRDDQLVIEGGDHVSALASSFLMAGIAAVTASGSDNGVERCHIRDPGERGVRLSGGLRASLTRANNYLRQTEVRRYGRWSWTYAPAVEMSGCGQIVEHNLLWDAPHTAILFTGNEHLIEKNEIHHVCQFSSDAGAIYTGRDWGYRGNEIRYNFIHDVASNFEGFGVQGIYLDDCVSGIHVAGNLLVRIADHGVQNGGGRDNIIENNMMAHCGGALTADARGTWAINHTPGSDWNLLERLTYDGIQYQAAPWASAYPALAAIPNDWSIVSNPANNWLLPEGCVFSRNVSFDNAAYIDAAPEVLAAYASTADNLDGVDPLFVDENNGNYNLQSGSPALAIPGFVPLPFDQMGLGR